MEIYLYYTKWDGKKPASHELLNMAAAQYRKTGGRECSRSFVNIKSDADICLSGIPGNTGNMVPFIASDQAADIRFSELPEQAANVPSSGIQGSKADMAPEVFGPAEHESLFALAYKENSTGSKKPYFKNLPQVHFSISDSGDYWACAFAPEEIGLDIQKVQKVKAQRIAHRFFHPLEEKWLAENGWENFCRIWTRKESYIKYTGRGMSDGLDGFSVIAPDGTFGVYLQSPESENQAAAPVVQQNVIFPAENKETCSCPEIGTKMCMKTDEGSENYEAALTAGRFFTVKTIKMSISGFP